MRHLSRYLNLQQPPPAIASAPDQQLRLIAVIPCLNEPDIVSLLSHLQSCDFADGEIEIIIVINHAADAAASVRRANHQTYAEIINWQSHAGNPALPVYVIKAFELPPKHAGVGLARKIGMDEAMRRFAAIGRPQGLIASLDADCRVSGNYFTALLAAFDTRLTMHAATISYAHPIDEIKNPRHRYAMTCYELFLRYIERGWRYAGLPYAFTAIGSCFALRANTCARHHGMNRRKAGEDFYFLHKLARERPLGQIQAACVYPSTRLTSRTPFGTAQAVADWYRSDASCWEVCETHRFEELKAMSDGLGKLFEAETDVWLKTLPKQLSAYLRQSGLEQAVNGMRNHAASADSFRGRFFVWFDGLKAWRYVNQTDSRIQLEQAAAQLTRLEGIQQPDCLNARSLLLLYRDRTP